MLPSIADGGGARIARLRRQDQGDESADANTKYAGGAIPKRIRWSRLHWYGSPCGLDGRLARAAGQRLAGLAARIGQYFAVRQEHRVQFADRPAVAGRMNIDHQLVADLDVGRVPAPAAHHVGTGAHQRPFLVGAIGFSDNHGQPRMGISPFPLAHGAAKGRELGAVKQSKRVMRVSDRSAAQRGDHDEQTVELHLLTRS